MSYVAILPFLLAAAAGKPANPPVAKPAPPHAFGFDDLARVLRIGDFDVSPDGGTVVASISNADVAGNRTISTIYRVSTDGKGAGRALVNGPGHVSGPKFSPDGREVAYVTDTLGTPQVFVMAAGGGPARQVSNLSTGASDVAWSRDGRYLLFTSVVVPDCPDDACNAAAAKARDESKIKARLVERLLYRHWTEWKDGQRSHVFRVNPDGTGSKDLTPGDFDAPSFWNDGAYDTSPDGKWVVYESNHDRVEATSTNGDIWLVPADGGTARNLTADNHAFDGAPAFSPDGKWIAYKSQARPGFESDKFDLKTIEVSTGKISVLTANFPDWVGDFAWEPSGAALDFSSVVEGEAPIYRVTTAGAIEKIVGGVTAAELKIRSGKLFFASSSFTQPKSIFRADKGGPIEITRANELILRAATMGRFEKRWYTSTDGRKVQAWLFTPPGFDPQKKYPAVMLIHGGPQGAWESSWSYRWNPEVFAGAGYVVYAPNPRGSTGYGQKFVDEISGDWGGQVYDDILKGADDLESLPYVDRSRIGAAGASYGGFMIAWIAGHTDRFKTLVCHDGVYDQPAMFGSTEELWFPIWEMKGTPWTSDLYEKWNPMRFAGNFKTPMLVVQGELDYRVPMNQGLELFTALQMRGVDSQLLEFPDEGHWVLKPGNSRLWHATVLSWLSKYLGGSPGPAGAKPGSITR
jgi:dipeptidyl aminopeptidase/acylaminoacyl peptidase